MSCLWSSPPFNYCISFILIFSCLYYRVLILCFISFLNLDLYVPVDPEYLIPYCYCLICRSILKINLPTKTRNIQNLFDINFIPIDQEIVMNTTNQELYQISNVTSNLRFNDIKSLLKIATVVVLAIIN